MSQISEISQIIRKEITTSIDSSIGPVLLEIAKYVKNINNKVIEDTNTILTLQSWLNDQLNRIQKAISNPNSSNTISQGSQIIGSDSKEFKPEELNGLETELAELRLQNQLITNQLYDVLQALGQDSKTSPVSDRDNQSESVLKEPSVMKSNLDLEKILRAIIKEELREVNTLFREEFNKIDMTLGKFFQKTVSDNKLVVDMIKQLQDFQATAPILQEPQRVIPSTTPINTSEQVKKSSNSPLSPYTTPLSQEKVSTFPTPIAVNPVEDLKTPVIFSERNVNTERRTLTSTPRKFIEPVKQSIPIEPQNIEEQIPKESPPVPATTRISKPSQIPYNDPDTADDIENITNMIHFFQKGDITPKDAIENLESLRDSILFDRKKEAPYRVTASRVLREALSDLNRERNRHVLTDGAHIQIVKLLTTLLSHIEDS